MGAQFLLVFLLPDVLSLQGTACSGARSMRGHGRAQPKTLIFLRLAQCWQT